MVSSANIHFRPIGYIADLYNCLVCSAVVADDNRYHHFTTQHDGHPEPVVKKSTPLPKYRLTANYECGCKIVSAPQVPGDKWFLPECPAAHSRCGAQLVVEGLGSA